MPYYIHHAWRRRPKSNQSDAHGLQRRLAQRRHPLVAHTTRAHGLIYRQPLRLKLGAGGARSAVARHALQAPIFAGARRGRLAVGLVHITSPPGIWCTGLRLQLAPSAAGFDQSAVVAAQHAWIWSVVPNGGCDMAFATPTTSVFIKYNIDAAPLAHARVLAAPGTPLQHSAAQCGPVEPCCRSPPMGAAQAAKRSVATHRNGAGVAGPRAGVVERAVAAHQTCLGRPGRFAGLAAGAGAACTDAVKRRPASITLRAHCWVG